MKVIVILPTYDEAQNLPELVHRLLELGIPGLSLLVVDDNSPDGTGKLAEDLAQEYPGAIEVLHRPAKMGLGKAYVAGFKHALAKGADFLLTMDADLSHSPAYIPLLLDKAEEYDVVVGSRYVSGGRDFRWKLPRRLLSRLGSWYARWATGLRLKDVTGGFRCFRSSALEELDLDQIKSEGFAFQIEVAYACEKQGLRVLELPYTYLERASGRSKLTWAIALEALWRVWEVRGRSRAFLPATSGKGSNPHT